MSTPSLATRFSRKAQRRILFAWLSALALGLYGLHHLLAEEKARDRTQWELRLQLVAGAQAKAVDGWMQSRLQSLENLADNVSLQLYFSEVLLAAKDAPGNEDDPANEPAAQTYIRNLLIASADLGGFSSPLHEIEHIGVSTPPQAGAGIALVTTEFKPIASTHAMPALEQLPAAIMTTKTPKAPVTSSAFSLQNGMHAVAFRLPVYGVQQGDESTPLGFVIAVATLDNAFYALLADPTGREKTAESLLLGHEDTGWRFMSALQDGTQAFALTVEDESTLVSVAAAQAPGVLKEGLDYRSMRSYAFAQPVAGTQWMVVRKIDEAVAMGDTTARAMFLYTAYVLCAAVISAGVVALWRNAVALRARQEAEHYKTLSERISKQEELLELIAETTPIATYIVDEDGKYRYANRRAAEEAEVERTLLPGKSVENVIGGAKARRLLAANADALKHHAEQLMIRREEENNRVKRVRQMRHVPLASLPLPDMKHSDTPLRGVLVVDEDITEIVRGEERRAATLRQLIDTLVEMVDRRDPHAARHSACVAMLAEQVGIQMKLDEQSIETARIAGLLMNIGKITVPESLLTTKDALKDKDKDRIRASILASVDVLEGVDFDGPVVDTLRQSLTKDPQLPSAQIIAAVNDFVAMISARSWRGRIKMDDAVAEIMKQAGQRYERAVIAALVHYLDNDGGREALEKHLGASA